MNIISAILNRRSIRSYQSKPVEKEKIEAILHSAFYAPSAMNIKPCELVVVENAELIQQLGSIKIGADHVKQASVVIVVVAENVKHWLEDSSLVASHIYLETTNQGLGTCWTHVHDSQTADGQNCEELVKELLSLSAEKRVLCLMPIGYPAEQKEPHSENEYDEKKVTWIK